MSNILKVRGTIEGKVVKEGREQKFTTEDYGVSIHSDSGNLPSVAEVIQTYGFIKDSVIATLNGQPYSH